MPDQPHPSTQQPKHWAGLTPAHASQEDDLIHLHFKTYLTKCSRLQEKPSRETATPAGTKHLWIISPAQGYENRCAESKGAAVIYASGALGTTLGHVIIGKCT